MQGLFIPVLVRVVQGRFLGVLLGMSRKAIGRVAVVGSFFVVASLLEVVSGGAVIFDGVLEVMSCLFVGRNDFLMLFGVVLLRRHRERGERVKERVKKGVLEAQQVGVRTGGCSLVVAPAAL